MTGQELVTTGRGLAIRIAPLAGRAAGRLRAWPPVQTILLAGILVISSAMAVTSLGMDYSMSREIQGLIDRLDKDASARMFEQSVSGSAQSAHVFVLPALRLRPAATKARRAEPTR